MRNNTVEKSDDFLLSIENIRDLFERKAYEDPDKIAAIVGDKNLTYKQLDEKANQLANYFLEDLGIALGDKVLLCLNRDENLLISILATLKCGAAYVPLDPSYPDGRIKYIIEDAQSSVVLTNVIHSSRFDLILSNIKKGAFSASVCYLDDAEFIHKIEEKKISAPNVEIHGDDLAYVIFTSGTSGAPKGVMIEHRSLLNYIYNVSKYIRINREDVTDLSTNIGFDLTVTTSICSLCLGATIAVYPSDMRDLGGYIQHLINNRVTVAKLVPSYFKLIISSLPTTCLRKVILGGEKLDPSITQSISEMESQGRLKQPFLIFDEYGPTEATVGTCISLVHPYSNKGIGHPYDNFKVYVLSEDMAPCAHGEVGELFIGGVGVARGYLNQPQLTDDRFIANPFQTPQEQQLNEYARLYRTGDLVQWIDGENLEYIGRRDFQVKIRGYRIELEEIEVALQSHADVFQACVNVYKLPGSDSQLIGYIVPGEFTPSELELKEFLERKIPEYMIPSMFVFLPSMPLTFNGKIDRDVLPLPDIQNTEYVAPSNEIEANLCKVLAETFNLPKEKVGVTDDFFRLGGDSILAIQFASKVRHKFNLSIMVKEIFKWRTIQGICANSLTDVVPSNIKPKISRKKETATGEFPLLPIQNWFYESDFQDPHHFNQSFLIHTPKLDVDRLRDSIAKLTSYHDAFRMRFQPKGAASLNVFYNPSVDAVELNIFDVSSLPQGNFDETLQSILTQWQSHFDIENGPIFSFGYLHGFSDGSARIFVSLHHLIVDAVSWRIITEDLKDVYEGKIFVPKGSSYKQWSSALSHYVETHQHEKEYWNAVMVDHDPSRFNEFIIETFFTKKEVELSTAYTKRMLQDVNKSFNTQVNDVLLTAFAYALSELTNADSHHVILEGHGREEIDPSLDVSRTVGWFTTFFPVRLIKNTNIQESLINTKETLRGIPTKGIGYGALFGLSLKHMPRVRFNYLGQFDSSEFEANSHLDKWQLIPEDAGLPVSPNNVEHNIINVNGMVLNGKLKVCVESKCKSETTEMLAYSFKRNLEHIIDYASGREGVKLTSSDVGHIVTQEILDEIQSDQEIESIFQVNSLQKGFIAHAVTEEDDDAYHVQMVWKYDNPLQPIALEKAWKIIQQRFSCLRLWFSWRDTLLQIVDKEGTLDWRYLDYSKFEDPDERISQILKLDRDHTFKLEQGSLFRVYLIKCREDHYTCIFSHHHAILDGWGITILLKNLHEAYLKILDNEPLPMGVDRNYEEIQKYLQSINHEDDDFWNDYLSQIEEPAELSFLLPHFKPELNKSIKECRRLRNVKEEYLYISDQLHQRLLDLARGQGVTLGAIMQFAWHRALHGYSGSPQTVVGTVLSGRDLPVRGADNAVGMLIKTVPFVLDHSKLAAGSILDAIRKVLDINNELSEKGDADLSGFHTHSSRLFDSLFIFENFPNPSKGDYNNRLNITFLESIEKLDFPIAAVVYELSGQLVFKLKYEADLFESSTVGQLAKTIEVILEQISLDADKKVSSLEYMNEELKNRVLFHWNDTQEPYSHQSSIPEIFEGQVRSTPLSLAVIANGRKFTYSELNSRINQLAYYLRSSPVLKQNPLIALCLDRDENILTSLLAVLKIGGAFVPMDPSHPEDRIQYMLQDTKSKVILTNQDHEERLITIAKKVDPDIAVISLDSPDIHSLLSEFSSQNLEIYPQSQDLAYIMYTSGSTGNPKGVMIEHNSFVAFIEHMHRAYFPEAKPISTYSVTNYIFDIFGMEWGLPLFTGGFVEIGNTEITTLDCSSYDFIQMTPSVCEILLDVFTEADETQFFIGGEKLTANLKKRLVQKTKIFVNFYGPTESTIWSTSKTYSQNDNFSPQDIGIGKPLGNEQVYVLDESLNPIPPGGIGELYIGGVGLARGYLNNPMLTEQKFLDNPFCRAIDVQHDCTKRIYKTGDIVRWMDSAELEYIGRNDFQVKLRGHRLELGEIESAINTINGIHQSLVMVSEGANPDLVAYYVSDQFVDDYMIIDHLKQRLPTYMVPLAYTHLQALPLTANGKVDRKALPRQQQKATRLLCHPTNDKESFVRKVWAECLNMKEDSISIDDHFLGLGGSSITAIRLFRKLNNFIPENMTASAILKYPTIQEFVAFLNTYESEKSNQGEVHVL